MRWDQISGILDRVIAVGLTWAVAKGYITQSQAAEWLPLILGVLAAAWGWYVNRDKALVQAAAKIEDTTVITKPELAADTPERNIVSAAANKVVPAA